MPSYVEENQLNESLRHSARTATHLVIKIMDDFFQHEHFDSCATQWGQATSALGIDMFHFTGVSYKHSHSFAPHFHELISKFGN